MADRKTDIFNTRGESIGKVLNGIYFTKRDYAKGQIFYKMGPLKVAIDCKILSRLISMQVFDIDIWIQNFPLNCDFKDGHYRVTVQEFLLLSKRVDFNKRDKYGNDLSGFAVQRLLDIKKMRYWAYKLCPEEIR